MAKTAQTYGSLARSDIRYAHGQMKPGRGETAKEFGARLYYMQMEIYSSYVGHDLDQEFTTLPAQVQRQWEGIARAKMNKREKKYERR